ncbi:TOMM system kinase/cyclase fusion protein [Pseudoalteromonas sp. JC3]|uniref:TOMM system kinase/cyclase fusion protein n=1 Tax=Pseudoalteromonas sp. JC3 TaxID=2810196 RepID=UPI0019D0CAD5|nr:TOMM system kinase/cyclase fusion protein [Pseudoalteromonas sp. JC3]MBR8843396.1 TOMM system kinase/cyclase fusion protein [Pseudoalteromonas sp. JC3]WJE11340.1 TOMM system kinase/cyclase fusion protein [Pseudoalteromonas sp. JC3]
MSLTQFSDSHIVDVFQSDKYQLLEKIGEGGFGKVFKARQINTGQIVALKFLALEPQLEATKKQRYAERFNRETLLCSQLNHPNIVRLLDKGQLNENLMFGVFEYVEGQTLRDYLSQNGAIDSVYATDIMLQVLDALIHAHQQGIIHRDIKPTNIMLSQSGAKTYAKILDFGIGTLAQESRQHDFETITLTQETLGTPSYSAPEQLRGEPASAKSDLYVWGLVFLECLTGVPAVTGTSVASIYHKQLSDVHIPIPSALLGHPLAGLLRRVLNKSALERVITATEAFSELARMNVSNLVGVLNDVKAQHGYDETTIMIRDDDPNHRAIQEYTALTERKQLTVLAVRLSVKALDNNEKDFDVIDTVYKSQRNHFIDIATRYGAYHVGNLADTSLFYFGYPVSSDNDARLSARTALEMISELAKRNALMQEAHRVALNAHIGIHTGIFITYANAVPEGHHANIAAALSREAGERQVLCSAESRSLLDAFSEFNLYGQVQIGPLFELTPVYNLQGERRIEAFGFMRGTKNHHELVGRHIELEQTLSLINNEVEGATRIAHIHGEAGIGKSRLLQEIRANAPQYQHLVAQCLPEHQNNALYPILTLVKYLFNTEQLDAHSANTVFSYVLSNMDSKLDLAQAIPVLLVWLNISLDDEITPSTLSPDEQKQVLFKGLCALLLSNRHGLSKFKLYIIEDIHWADSTTLEFLHHFVGALASGDVLLSTSRQAVPTQLKDLTLVDVCLKKLTEKATEDFIINLFDGRRVSEQVLKLLTSRTDGIPLFIEELVNMLKQKALVGDKGGEIDFLAPDKLDQVPTSLRESLQQKLDSLSHAKETAQLAATIGREFEYDLLVAASSLSENQIQNDLNELIANDLIVQQRRVDNDSYIFKHALVRDAAYESMGKHESHAHHMSIIEVLNNTGMSQKQPLLTTHHLAKVGEHDAAVELLLTSAKSAAAIYSVAEASIYYAEALNFFQNGLIDNQPLLHKIKNALASSRIAYNGWLDTLAKKHVLQNISELATILDPKERFITMRGEWLHAYATGDILKAHNIGLQLHENKSEYPPHQHPVIFELLSQSYFSLGEFDKVIALVDTLPKEGFFDNSSQAITDNYGFCSELTCIAFKALSQLLTGKVDLAQSAMNNLAELSKDININDISSATNGIWAWFKLIHASIQNDSINFKKYQDEAKYYSSTGVSLAKNSNNAGWLGYNNMLNYLANLDDIDSLQEFEEKISSFAGYRSHRTFYYYFLYKVLLFNKNTMKDDAYNEYLNDKASTKTLYLQNYEN